MDILIDSGLVCICSGFKKLSCSQYLPLTTKSLSMIHRSHKIYFFFAVLRTVFNIYYFRYVIH